MKISEIAQLIGAQPNECNIEIEWLLTDSRSLSFPAQTLFFALRTQRNSGENYIHDLYKNGVRCFVVTHLPDAKNEMPDAVFLVVNNTLRALQCVAAVHRHRFEVPVLGITGSNGKTIVKEWLFQLLRNDQQICRSPRSYNSQIGVPLSVWQMNKNTQMAIFEAGISEANEMQFLQEIIDPTIGIFTNLADAHQENFSSIEEKCAEKIKLFTDVDVLIYNIDCKPVHKAALSQYLPTFTWGKNELATVQVWNVRYDNGRTYIEYRYQEKLLGFEIPFSDQASVENSLHCLSCMLYLGYEPETIAQRMLKLEPVAMRLEVKQGVNNCLIINDTYNSDLASLGIALDFLNQQHDELKRTKTVVLSDILQNGQSQQELYETVATLLKNRNIANVVGIGEQISAFSAVFSDLNAVFYKSTKEFIASNDFKNLHDQLILIKGSRQFRLERISRKLETIVNETVLEVNLSALENNVNYFRSKLNPATKLMSMVKASSYGIGAIDMAHALQRAACDYLAVAVADEGAELRKGGIRLPIITMDPHPNAFATIFAYNLEPAIYSFKLLREFIHTAEQSGISNYPIHIKIDSGMHRLGFQENDLSELCQLLNATTAVRINSVFSHLAAADEPAHDDFTLGQIQLFERCANFVQNEVAYRFMKHILNSAGIERFPQYQFDMVRLGIGHYNISALDENSLANVCAFKTVILQIKQIQAGESVGYGRAVMLTEDTTIGIIPVGYADGLDRRLSNGVGEVYVNGVRCPILGRICMDLTIIDLSGVNAHEGDQVEIFGDHISLVEVAAKIGTISYEVLTGIAHRVKRVYYRE